MNIHSDGYFAIGKSHNVCEDYVRCGKTPAGRAYAIVSDGCSGSDDTDIGARLLVRAAEAFIRASDDAITTMNFKIIIEMAHTYAAGMQLPSACLDATLIIALESDIKVSVWKMGDGVIACRRRDGYATGRGNSIGYEYQEFVTGAPYYANYLRDAERQRSFLEMPNNQVIFNTYTNNDATTNARNGEALTDKESKETWNMDEYMMTVNQPVMFYKDEVDLVVLMTDGALSFRKGLDPVSPTEIVKQILDVKVSAGEFMVRRAKRFLGNYCTAQGWDHYDDFGVGAIFIEGGTE